MEQQLSDLIKKYESKGFYKSYMLLLDPKTGLEMLSELEDMDLDWGLTGVHVFHPTPDGELAEGLDYMALDGVNRDDDFVSTSIQFSKDFLTEGITPIVTYVHLSFESEKHRNKRKDDSLPV